MNLQFGGLEAVITAICDEYPMMRRHRELFVLGLVLVCFLGGLPTVTNVRMPLWPR